MPLETWTIKCDRTQGRFLVPASRAELDERIGLFLSIEDMRVPIGEHRLTFGGAVLRRTCDEQKTERLFRFLIDNTHSLRDSG